MVINNTKVLPARLYGKKDTGANVEFLLLKRIEGDKWECLAKPGKRAKVGQRFTFGEGITKVRVYIWMEGQDPDNTVLSSKGGGIEVQIGLTKSLTEGDVTKREADITARAAAVTP